MTTHTVKTAHDNVPLIIDGAKTATVRYGFESTVRPGDVFKLVDAETGGVVATRDVEMSVEAAVVDAPGVIDACGFQYPHSKPGTLLTALNGHYPDDDITLTSRVDVFGYEPPREHERDRRGL